MKNLVVGIGEALWDVMPEGKKMGGAPANFAYQVAQFGLPSCVVSAVGNDELGQEIIDNFNAKGLNYLIEKVPYPTGTVQVEIGKYGSPRYEIKENVAWDHIPFTPALEDIARNTRAVCFGSLAQRSEESRATIARFLDAMPKEEDSLVVFDANLRQHFYTKEILQDSLQRCNILKVNDEELDTFNCMLGYYEDDQSALCKLLLKDYGLKMLILTCGAKGSYVYAPRIVSYHAARDVEVADTVGAGDSFTAAFVAAILKGMHLGDAHRLAVRTSAYVCTQHGAMPVLPADIVG